MRRRALAQERTKHYDEEDTGLTLVVSTPSEGAVVSPDYVKWITAHRC
jgi:hypothetical protein